MHSWLATFCFNTEIYCSLSDLYSRTEATDFLSLVTSSLALEKISVRDRSGLSTSFGIDE